MDKSGQHLRYNNGIINSVAFKHDSRIGYCKMYRSENPCLCMTVRDKQNQFGGLPECNGMCSKQNINIYIENCESRTNNEKYNLKCDSANLDPYPFYKAVKSESNMSAINNVYIGRNLSKNKSLYTDMVWVEPSNKPDNIRNWRSTKNSSNVNYYPYLNNNRQYVKEGNPCDQKQLENKSSINHVEVNISPEVENSLLVNEINKKYTCSANRSKGSRISNVPEPSLLGTIPSSTCNNLYVAPPSFTVDKFITPDHVDTRRATQSSQPCSRNLYSNQRMAPNFDFEYNAMEDHSLQTEENILIKNNEQRIGIKLVEGPNISLMHLEKSIEPIGFDIHKQHNRHLPIKKEVCNYEKMETYRIEKNICVNVPYTVDSNIRNDLMRHKSNPISFSIDQYNGRESMELENRSVYQIADFSATFNTPESSQHNIAFHDAQYKQYQRNAALEAYTSKSYANSLPPSAKNVIRETRKPNYRELINHVHALRSATSEDDLNMQIIKRTLNYNQPPKDVANPVVPRKLSTKVFRRNEDSKCPRTLNNNNFEETYEKGSFKFHDPKSLQTNIVSPLDLSVKTIKTKADSTDNYPNCKVLITENGYPPKFNFIPNFSESRKLVSKPDNSINTKPSKTTLEISHSSSEDLTSKCDINMPNDLTECYIRGGNNLNVKRTTVGCRLQNELILQTSIPEMKGNIVCSLQNCPNPKIVQTCVNQQESEQGPEIKVEVTLKRKIPFDKTNDNELLHKKICFESFYHSGFTSSSLPHNYSGSPVINLKQTIQNSEINNVDCINYALNGNIEHISINKKDESGQTNAFIMKNEIVTKKEPTMNKVVETKPDVSSIIAARIRTKAELKGFTFQEESGGNFQKPLSNKENCNCNCATQSSIQLDEVDLSEWENTCKGFVDQLLQSCKKLHPEIEESKLCEDKTSLASLQQNIRSTDYKYDALSEQKNLSEQSSKKLDEFKKVIAESADELVSSIGTTGSTCVLNEVSDANDNDNYLKQKTDDEILNNRNDFIDLEPAVISPEINNSDICSEKNSSKDESNNEEPQQDMENNSVNKIVTTKYATRNKNKEQKLLKNNSRSIDLTKISVVRLKREKYASKRYTPYDKNLNYKVQNVESTHSETNKLEEDSLANKHASIIGRSFPSITKSTLRRKNISLQCVRRRQQNRNTAVENLDPKFSTITTRLRRQRLQLQNRTEPKGKRNKIDNFKVKKSRLHCYQNSNERELSNDHDKIYLEVYRYKRALKVPPNLITIGKPYTHRISASLPDLDVDLQNASKNDNISRDAKVEDVPKSIIDVLHSRVLKSKCQVKSSHKSSKMGHQHASKSTTQQCNNAKLNVEPLNLCQSSNHSYEHRNVFEPQVLASRTRREYKIQLNKEIIREVFCGGERPASAPPEINNINNDFETAFEKRYNKCFQQLNLDIEHKINGEYNKVVTSRTTCNQENLDESNHVIESIAKEQIKDNEQQSVVSSKCKRKRNGRPYRRKFSSGFDYLRKRKKTNTHSLYRCSHLKTRVENCISEGNIQLKSESDVSREIQKWVLNKGVGQSTLHKAARLGYIDVIVYCLEKMGLNPDHKDNAGYTPLHDACVNGSLEIARVLLQYGANHSEGAHSGIRPLHEASENGHIEIVRMLLSYGADPLLETYSGQTPLMLASDTAMNDFIAMHLIDVQVNKINRKSWRFPGPWKISDDSENGYDALKDVPSLDTAYHINGKVSFKNFNCTGADFYYSEDKQNNFSNNGTKKTIQNRAIKNDVCEFEIFVDAADADGELFEFEEANMPLPPLYLLKDEGMEKWVLLSDLCSLLKVKSKDTLLNKIFPSISPSTVSRAFIRELKMCEFLEKATCLQLLCAGEKINICHSKVVLIQYNENVRKLLGVKTVFMKL